MHDSDQSVIPTPIPGQLKSLIPTPIPRHLHFSDSDSIPIPDKKWNHSGIDSDSGVGIVHHW